MRMKLVIASMAAACTVVSLSAHVTVSPLQSKAGATQKYELRVHNEAKAAATSVDLDIPDGVVVSDIAKTPAGTATTKKAGDRITTITWQTDVQPGKFVALPFTATNPAGVAELHWTMHEHLADGSTIGWSDKPGSAQKGSITKLDATIAASLDERAAAEHTWTGTISDKICGGDHAKMGGKRSDRDRTLACAKGGSPYVLVSKLCASTQRPSVRPARPHWRQAL